MKVLMVNGSPHEKGCTYTALTEIAKTLQEEQIDTETFLIGKKPISGCIACGACEKTGKCVINDRVNEFLTLAKDADGFIFGTPVYFASSNGSMISFMDRVFFAARAGSRPFYLKPAAAICAARRAGATATLDQMNKYFLHGQMPVVSSQYWNMVHGNTPEEITQDLEGLQIMRTLGRNMAWLLRCIAAGKQMEVPMPETEKRIATNFIR